MAEKAENSQKFPNIDLISIITFRYLIKYTKIDVEYRPTSVVINPLQFYNYRKENNEDFFSQNSEPTKPI